VTCYRCTWWLVTSAPGDCYLHTWSFITGTPGDLLLTHQVCVWVTVTRCTGNKSPGVHGHTWSFITGTPGDCYSHTWWRVMLPARCLLLHNQTSGLAKKHFPVWLCDVLISWEWILLNATRLTHQQCTTQVAWTQLGDASRQLRRQVQTLLATHLLQHLYDLSSTHNHQRTTSTAADLTNGAIQCHYKCHTSAAHNTSCVNSPLRRITLTLYRRLLYDCDACLCKVFLTFLVHNFSKDSVVKSVFQSRHNAVMMHGCHLNVM